MTIICIDPLELARVQGSGKQTNGYIILDVDVISRSWNSCLPMGCIYA